MILGGIAARLIGSKKQTAYNTERPPNVNATGNP